MSHWCKDIERDEAVRAAEDNRQGPLPTLGEAIAAVTERRPLDAGGGGNVTGTRTQRVSLSLQRMGELIDERDAAIRERDKLLAERITQRLTADRFAAAVAEADKLRARVAELESAAKLAPAANADVKSNHAAPAASGAAGTEPVAWGFVAMDGVIVHVSTFEPVPGTATVVPLYAAPPPANGWLTAEERRLIEGMMESASAFPPTMHWHSGCTVRDTLRILQSILARSSPPEVVLPDFTPDAVRNLDTKYLAGWDQCMALAKRAIIAAGVKVKEVGK